MIHINGHWENVNTLEDIARVIREYYNPELADEMEFQIERMVDAFNNKIEELLEDQTYQWESCDDDADCWCDD